MDFVEEMREIEAIKQLKYRYMRGIDEKLWDQIEQCFTPDATCAYSGGKYTFEGREAIMKFLVGSMDRGSFLSSHRVHHPEIQLTSPTTATGTWALEDYVIDTQNGISLHGAAFYGDEYVKTGADWKIKHTGYERTFEQVRPRAEEGWTLTDRRFPD
jgi:hypothetical protein